MIRLKMTAALERLIHQDLKRPHAFAYERVGFVKAGLSLAGGGVTILTHGYSPVMDEDYLNDPSVGAMMGPGAMHKAMAWAFEDGVALFHVHTHGGQGIPRFSSVDTRESQKFVPDFFKVRPERPHGAMVLSNTHAYGHVWLDAKSRPLPIEQFQIIGPQLRKWQAA